MFSSLSGSPAFRSLASWSKETSPPCKMSWTRPSWNDSEMISRHDNGERLATTRQMQKSRGWLNTRWKRANGRAKSWLSCWTVSSTTTTCTYGPGSKNVCLKVTSDVAIDFLLTFCFVSAETLLVESNMVLTSMGPFSDFEAVSLPCLDAPLSLCVTSYLNVCRVTSSLVDISGTINP